MTLREFVINYRHEHDMSIRAFAAMVDMSVQQISNIEKGIGNNGKPMTSTYKTYQKIAHGIGMQESDFLRLLNDDVLVNPSEKENPVTESDGLEESIDLSQLSEDRKKLIQDILKASDQDVSFVLQMTERLLSDR